MSKYLHGMHDPGAEHLMSDKPGWIVITESIGSDPGDHSTRDYSDLASRGFSVIVRLNNAHDGTNGTYPTSDKYADFATRCANFCKGMRGASIVIIGNEPNHVQERPHGQPILPLDAAKVFNLCYTAIKNLEDRIAVLTPAVAPWDNSTKYDGNKSGDWLIYYRHMIDAIVKCDGFAIHAYTHGPDPALIRDMTMVEGWFWHFPVFEQQLNTIPPALRTLPAYITETNPGDHGWNGYIGGWLPEAYAFVDEWNREPGTQKVKALIPFRWTTYEGQEKWGISQRSKVTDDFAAAVGKGYPTGTTYKTNGGGNTVFIPAVKGNDKVTPEDALPARDIDERAIDKGIAIVPVTVPAGMKFWRVKRIYVPDVEETRRLGPDHHILANALIDGKRDLTTLRVWWGNDGPDESTLIFTKENDGYAWSADFGMSPGDFSVKVHDVIDSETVTGVKMGWWDAEGRWNPGAHTSVLIDFELVTMPASGTTEPPNIVDADWDENWFDAPREGIVNVSLVNVRGGPGTDQAIVGAANFGDRITAALEVVRQGYHWLNIGDKRWIAGEYVTWDGELVTPPSTPDKDWERAWPVVLKIEGGLSLDPNDTGNWYQGKLVGTKYGISAAVWGGQYDIPNLTKTQALEIYKEHYWFKAGCDKLTWPMSLIVFDTAINHGVGVAVALLNKKPTREEAYLGLRALRYFEDPKWRNFGIAWGNRIEHLDDIVDGEIVV